MKKFKFSRKEEVRFQEKLAHFLRDYRYRHDLQKQELADILGYTPARYSELESSDEPNSRYIRALEFIYNIKKINKDTSLVDFMNFIEGNSSRCNARGRLNRSLTTNEAQLLKLFDKVSPSIIIKFLGLVKKYILKGKLSIFLKLMSVLVNYPAETIEKLLLSIESLKSSKT